MARRSVTYTGPSPSVRLPVGMLVDRDEDDEAPRYAVALGETIKVPAEIAEKLVERDGWKAGRGGLSVTVSDELLEELESQDVAEDDEEDDVESSSSDVADDEAGSDAGSSSSSEEDR